MENNLLELWSLFSITAPGLFPSPTRFRDMYTRPINCFLLDPWWNPATETQAVDRTHRIGQTRNVMVYCLIAKDTIEEKVLALADRKAELFAGVINDRALLG
jgi:SNF2 family DNA or RNA helicase